MGFGFEGVSCWVLWRPGIGGLSAVFGGGVWMDWWILGWISDEGFWGVCMVDIYSIVVFRYSDMVTS